MSDFLTKFKEFLTGGEEGWENEPEVNPNPYETTEEWPVDSVVEDTTFVEPAVPVTPVAQVAPVVTTPVYQQPASTVVMLSPYDIRTSQIVCDHIREGHIVICNLTGSSNNQRVVDYISGGVYAFDGKIEPTAVKTTFVCTPKNVNLIVDAGEAAETVSKVSAL